VAAPLFTGPCALCLTLACLRLRGGRDAGRISHNLLNSVHRMHILQMRVSCHRPILINSCAATAAVVTIIHGRCEAVGDGEALRVHVCMYVCMYVAGMGSSRTSAREEQALSRFSLSTLSAGSGTDSHRHISCIVHHASCIMVDTLNCMPRSGSDKYYGIYSLSASLATLRADEQECSCANLPAKRMMTE